MDLFQKNWVILTYIHKKLTLFIFFHFDKTILTVGLPPCAYAEFFLKHGKFSHCVLYPLHQAILFNWVIQSSLMKRDFSPKSDVNFLKGKFLLSIHRIQQPIPKQWIMNFQESIISFLYFFCQNSYEDSDSYFWNWSLDTVSKILN